MIVLIILVFGVIAVTDVPKLIRLSKAKDIVVYAILFTVALILSLLLSLGVELPSPMLAVQAFMKEVLGLHY